MFAKGKDEREKGQNHRLLQSRIPHQNPTNYKRWTILVYFVPFFFLWFCVDSRFTHIAKRETTNSPSSPRVPHSPLLAANNNKQQTTKKVKEMQENRDNKPWDGQLYLCHTSAIVCKLLYKKFFRKTDTTVIYGQWKNVLLQQQRAYDQTSSRDMSQMGEEDDSSDSSSMYVCVALFCVVLWLCAKSRDAVTCMCMRENVKAITNHELSASCFLFSHPFIHFIV